jgi:hypothetical protein
MYRPGESFDLLGVATIFALLFSMISFIVVAIYHASVVALALYIIYNAFWWLSLYLSSKSDAGKIAFMVAVLTACFMWIAGPFILSQILHIDALWIFGFTYAPIILLILIAIALTR